MQLNEVNYESDKANYERNYERNYFDVQCSKSQDERRGETAEMNTKLYFDRVYRIKN